MCFAIVIRQAENRKALANATQTALASAGSERKHDWVALKKGDATEVYQKVAKQGLDLISTVELVGHRLAEKQSPDPERVRVVDAVVHGSRIRTRGRQLNET